MTEFNVAAEEGFGDVFTIEEFDASVKCGAFIPDDGMGLYGTETHYSWGLCVWGTYPPRDATHVHWFNR